MGTWDKKKGTRLQTRDVSSSQSPWYPFSNFSTMKLMQWCFQYPVIDPDDDDALIALIQGVFLHPKFSVDELRDFSADRELDKRSKYKADLSA
ncbi:hypothetical protein CERSUDRAFT_96326 [Gelatoporia subvermispora B]|uniref:Uncharacterized protein n=1 Tax=Ceriporiopsis subvermispora (strain B) TaxID=914234 RepID=M2QVH5_CERS8|nr:hypothetical protein CERSUDRAFT_96326 [Gelatoporia subvermispora B]